MRRNLLQFLLVFLVLLILLGNLVFKRDKYSQNKIKIKSLPLANRQVITFVTKLETKMYENQENE